MPNLRIIYDNAADRATLTSSSQAGLLGPANLKTDRKSQVLRSVGTSVTILATLPAGEITGGVVLPFCNLTATARIRVRGYAAPGDSATVFDTGLVLACPYAQTILWEWGAVPPGVNAFSYGAGTYGRVWWTRTTARHFYIELADPDNSAGYIECSRLVLGNYWEPEFNATYGASVTPVDTSTQNRTAAGEMVIDAGFTYRKLSIALGHVSAQDRANLWRIVWGNGKRRPLFISLFPNHRDSELEHAHQIYGRLPDLAAISASYYQAYATTIDVEEF